MNWKKNENQRLVEAILSLKSNDEAKRFLRDLLTEQEIEDISRRLQAAEMLSLNIPYSAIEKATGFSSTTVARVSKWLNNGMGGYKSVLATLSSTKLGINHHHNPSKLGKGLSLSA